MTYGERDKLARPVVNTFKVNRLRGNANHVWTNTLSKGLQLIPGARCFLKVPVNFLGLWLQFIFNHSYYMTQHILVNPGIKSILTVNENHNSLSLPCTWQADFLWVNLWCMRFFLRKWVHFLRHECMHACSLINQIDSV